MAKEVIQGKKVIINHTPDHSNAGELYQRLQEEKLTALHGQNFLQSSLRLLYSMAVEYYPGGAGQKLYQTGRLPNMQQPTGK